MYEWYERHKDEVCDVPEFHEHTDIDVGEQNIIARNQRIEEEEEKENKTYTNVDPFWKMDDGVGMEDLLNAKNLKIF